MMDRNETMVFAFRWDGEREGQLGSGLKDGGIWHAECRSFEELLEEQNTLMGKGFTILG